MKGRSQSISRGSDRPTRYSTSSLTNVEPFQTYQGKPNPLKSQISELQSNFATFDSFDDVNSSFNFPPSSSYLNNGSPNISSLDQIKKIKEENLKLTQKLELSNEREKILHQKYKLASIKIKDLQSTFTKTDTQYKMLIEAKEKEKQEILELRSKLKVISKRNEQLETENKNFSSLISHLKSENEALEKEKQKIKDEFTPIIENLRTRISDKKQKMLELSKKNLNLIKKNQLLEESKKRAESDFVQLSANLSDYLSENEQLKSDNSNLKSEISNLKSNFKKSSLNGFDDVSFESENEIVRDNLSVCSDISIYQNQIEFLSNENVSIKTQFGTQIEEMLKEISDLSQKVYLKTLNESQNKKIIENLKRENQKLSQENQKLSQENQKLSHEKHKISQENQKLSQENQSLLSKSEEYSSFTNHTDLIEEINILNKSLVEEKGKNDRLAVKSSSLESKISKQKRKTSMLMIKMRESDSEISELKEQNQKNEQTITNLQNTIIKVNKNNTELSLKCLEISRFENELNKVKSENEKLQKTINKMTEKERKFNDKINKLSKENSDLKLKVLQLQNKEDLLNQNSIHYSPKRNTVFGNQESESENEIKFNHQQNISSKGKVNKSFMNEGIYDISLSSSDANENYNQYSYKNLSFTGNDKFIINVEKDSSNLMSLQKGLQATKEKENDILSQIRNEKEQTNKNSSQLQKIGKKSDDENEFIINDDQNYRPCENVQDKVGDQISDISSSADISIDYLSNKEVKDSTKTSNLGSQNIDYNQIIKDLSDSSSIMSAHDIQLEKLDNNDSGSFHEEKIQPNKLSNQMIDPNVDSDNSLIKKHQIQAGSNEKGNIFALIEEEELEPLDQPNSKNAEEEESKLSNQPNSKNVEEVRSIASHKSSKNESELSNSAFNIDEIEEDEIEINFAQNGSNDGIDKSSITKQINKSGIIFEEEEEQSLNESITDHVEEEEHISNANEFSNNKEEKEEHHSPDEQSNSNDEQHFENAPPAAEENSKKDESLIRISDIESEDETSINNEKEIQHDEQNESNENGPLIKNGEVIKGNNKGSASGELNKDENELSNNRNDNKDDTNIQETEEANNIYDEEENHDSNEFSIDSNKGKSIIQISNEFGIENEEEDEGEDLIQTSNEFGIENEEEEDEQNLDNVTLSNESDKQQNLLNSAIMQESNNEESKQENIAKEANETQLQNINEVNSDINKDDANNQEIKEANTNINIDDDDDDDDDEGEGIIQISNEFGVENEEEEEEQNLDNITISSESDKQKNELKSVNAQESNNDESNHENIAKEANEMQLQNENENENANHDLDEHETENHSLSVDSKEEIGISNGEDNEISNQNEGNDNDFAISSDIKDANDYIEEGEEESGQEIKGTNQIELNIDAEEEDQFSIEMVSDPIKEEGNIQISNEPVVVINKEEEEEIANEKMSDPNEEEESIQIPNESEVVINKEEEEEIANEMMSDPIKEEGKNQNSNESEVAINKEEEEEIANEMMSDPNEEESIQIPNESEVAINKEEEEIANEMMSDPNEE